ncbi:hypothetical protein [Streptomyces formicae]|uniref:Uncharacterized protein n=1 Tax=Streptomyces formicae TaxID=1616117 RepID=A0ABY3WNR9_9ACTN|nr:hypothetical protein [Streptomyces formicae]UNM13780.1 hypothetical protein J4032_22045 [Streptomyces formicae]
MRRITTLGLAAFAALVLTACGSDCGEPQPDPSTSTPASPTLSTGTVEGGSTEGTIEGSAVEGATEGTGGTSAGTDTGGTTP